MIWRDDDIIQSIRQGEDQGLIDLYSRSRHEFMSWASASFRIDEALATDAYQDAIIAMRKNIVNNKFKEGGSSLKTYLFAIGKNMILQRFKKESRETTFEDIGVIELVETPVWGESRLSDRQQSIRDAVGKLQEPCLSIIRMFYYHRFSMEVIAARLNYKNGQVVKSQKSRCMQKLKDLAHTGRIKS